MEFVAYALLSFIMSHNINAILPLYMPSRFTSKAGRAGRRGALFVLCLFPVIPHFLPSFFTFGVLFVIYLSIYYKGNPFRKGAIAMIFLSIMGSWSYLSACVMNPLIGNPKPTALELALFVLLLCLYLSYFTVMREYAELHAEDIAPLDFFHNNLWKAYSLIAVCPSLVILLLVINPPDTTLFVLVITFITIGAASIIFMLLFSAGNSYRIAEENARLKDNAEYYKELELQQTKLRQFKHDLMNQFTVLATYLDLGETAKAGEYLKELGAEASKLSVSYTKDTLVNAVLNAKQQKAQALGLKVEIYIDVADLRYNPSDLCTLIANSLDNAIEANPPDGLISMTMMHEEENIVFNCSNRFKAVPHKMKDGSFETSKKDKLNHGLGLRNIKEAVKRMGGTVDIDTSGGVFSLTATLPNVSQ